MFSYDDDDDNRLCTRDGQTTAAGGNQRYVAGGLQECGMDYELESKAHKAEDDYRNATVPTFGPRRLRNKTKAERSGPRKRRRKKKKNVKKVLDGNTQTRLSRDNKAGETRNFDVKNQIDGRNESKAKKRSIHEPRIGELGGDESVRRTKSDDMNAFTLFSFYSQLVGPPTPKYVHDTLQKNLRKI